LPEVLLTFTGLSWQKGAAAQVVSLVSQIRRVRKDIRISLLSHYADLDAGPAKKVGIDVVGYPLSRYTTPNTRSLELMLMRIGSAGWALARRAGFGVPIRDEGVISAYRRADLVLDLSGDSFRDPPGGKSIAHNVNLLACQAFGVPYALVSQSLGPFRWHSRSLTRYCLNQARLIYIRERRTWRVLTDLGVKTCLVDLAPDVAFTLPAASAEEVNQIFFSEHPNVQTLPRPWVGISTSSLFFTRLSRSNRKLFLRRIIELALHVNHTIGGSIFLVPHEIRPPQLGIDDVCAADIVAKALECPPWLHVIRGNYGPSEIKGIVSCFDAFVACRMHAGIAALSSGIPTAMISWSHKYAGVMEEVGLPEFVWDLLAPGGTHLSNVFDELWRQRRSVSERLRDFNTRAQFDISRAVEKILSFV